MTDTFGIPAVPPPEQILGETNLLYNMLVEWRAQLIRHLNHLHQRTHKLPLTDLAPINTDRLLGRNTPGVGPVEELTVGGGLGFTVANPGGIEITDGGVTNVKLRNSAACSVIGRSANSVGPPADIVAGGNARFLGRVSNVVSFLTPDLLFTVIDFQFNGSFLSGVDGATPVLAVTPATVWDGTLQEAWTAGFECPTGLVAWGGFSFTIPDELDTVVGDVLVRLIFVMGPTAGTGSQVFLSLTYGTFKDGEDSSAPSSSATITQTIDVDTKDPGDYVVVDFDSPISATDIAAKSRAVVTIARDGTGGTPDNYPDNILIVSVQCRSQRLFNL